MHIKLFNDGTYNKNIFILNHTNRNNIVLIAFHNNILYGFQFGKYNCHNNRYNTIR